MAKKFSETNTRNARIKIDYRGETPRVNFSYPNIKNYSEGSALPFLISCWIMGISLYAVGMFAINGVDVSDNVSIIHCFVLPLIKMLIGVAILFGPPLLLNKIFSNYWKKLYPKMQKLHSIMFDSYYTILINHNHIKYDKGKIYAEIPLFSNVFLDYKARGDFGKKLEYVEIKEWGVKSIIHRGKKEESATDLFWFARFYFNKEPKNGEIKVTFK